MAKVETKITLKEATALANELCDQIECAEDICVAGSIRRGSEEIGDIDIVVVPTEGFEEEVKNLIEVTSSGKKKIYGDYKGRPINFFMTDEQGWGAQLMTATGPAKYNIRKRYLVKRKGLRLNEYGLFDRESGDWLAGRSEKEIYDYLGWTNRPPKERE
jgi:DNA polymerase (family 10)|tara:strand:+ start:576 stop:1052 length:477 start_codon:yes stop_codon:yes gene_type:complete